MSPSVRISRKTALEIREFLTAFAYAARWIEEIDRAAKPKESVLADNKRLREALEKTEEQKNDAYHERNQLVVLVAKMALALGWNAGVREHPAEDKTWEDDWRTLVFVDLPAGQVSWHFHDSEKPLLAGLPRYVGEWDGHSTEEKYRRCTAPFPPPAEAPPKTEEKIGVGHPFSCVCWLCQSKAPAVAEPGEEPGLDWSLPPSRQELAAVLPTAWEQIDTLRAQLEEAKARFQAQVDAGPLVNRSGSEVVSLTWNGERYLLAKAIRARSTETKAAASVEPAKLYHYAWCHCGTGCCAGHAEEKPEPPPQQAEDEHPTEANKEKP